MAIDVGVEPVTRAVHDQSECGCAAQGEMKLGAWPVKRQMVFTSDKPSDALDLGRTESMVFMGFTRVKPQKDTDINTPPTFTSTSIERNTTQLDAADEFSDSGP